MSLFQKEQIIYNSGVFLLQSTPRWEVGSPLSFQSFDYTFYRIREFLFDYLDFHPVISLKPHLYSYLSKSHQCTMRLLYNLAEPDWVYIPCDNKLLNHTLCFTEKVGEDNYNNSNLQNIKDYSFCMTDHILMHQMCYVFLWFNLEKSKNVCKQLKAMPVNKSAITTFKQIFSSSSSLVNQFPQLILENNSNSTWVVQF